MKAFREALIHDLDADGFADMYAQTIAYGLLSARIADPKADHGRRLRSAHAHQPVPQGADGDLPARRRSADSRKWRRARLRRARRQRGRGTCSMRPTWRRSLRDFGDRKPEEDPVIHFYELFLKEYDAKKRMQRGVFYTPRPVVSYIVRSVHELLQTEFGLADGLADTATWGEHGRAPPGPDAPGGREADGPIRPRSSTQPPAPAPSSSRRSTSSTGRWSRSGSAEGHSRDEDPRPLERLRPQASACHVCTATSC